MLVLAPAPRGICLLGGELNCTLIDSAMITVDVTTLIGGGGGGVASTPISALDELKGGRKR